MPSLFDSIVYNEIITRINLLEATTQSKWGKMNVSQMLKHCTEAIGTATGDVTIKAPFVIKLMGPLMKKLIMSKNQYKQGLPTAKEFIFTDDRNFNIEKTKLIERLQKFYSIGEKSIDGLVHPVFGKLSSFEWGYSQWKHFDHHLRQFGV